MLTPNAFNLDSIEIPIKPDSEKDCISTKRLQFVSNPKKLEYKSIKASKKNIPLNTRNKQEIKNIIIFLLFIFLPNMNFITIERDNKINAVAKFDLNINVIKRNNIT